MRYDLCLLDRQGDIVAAEPFWAHDHLEAQKVGSALLEACKDVAQSYAVWCEGAVIAHGQRQRGRVTLPDLIEEQEVVVLDLEDRLQCGFTAIARSRRLLQAAERLRQRRSL